MDANAEPLWYVVSPGWALSNSTVPPLQTFINSDSVGQLTVDGVANDSVALIIAPGPAIITTPYAASRLAAQQPLSGVTLSGLAADYLDSIENAAGVIDVFESTPLLAAPNNDRLEIVN